MISGVTITLDNGNVLTYTFSTQANRKRFESILRFDNLTDTQITDILAKYDAYRSR